MALNGIQIVLVLVIVLLVIRTVKRLREKSMRFSAFVGWMLLWSLGGLAVLLPDITGRFAEVVGVGRGVDAVVYIAVLVLFYIVFKMYNKMVTMEKEITKLVTALALRDEREHHERKK